MTTPTTTTTTPTPNSELQATLEFCVELHKFYNVDLFLRGYYQLQLALRVVGSKLPVRVEISSSGGGGGGCHGNKKNVVKKKDPAEAATATTTSAHPPTTNSSPSTNTTPPQIHSHTPSNSTTSTLSAGTTTTITNSSSTTTTPPFRILFRNEELELKEIFLFRIHFTQELTSNFNMTKIIEELNRAEYYLDLKLCFNDQIVSSRTCQVHYYLNSSSIHYYRNVFFDYFHLCAVSFSVHGGLVAVHISKGTLLNCGSNNKPDLIPHNHTHYNQNNSPTSCLPSTSSYLFCSTTPSPTSLTTAKTTHDLITNLLLESNSSLKTKLIEFLQVLGRHDLVGGFKEGLIIRENVNFDAFLKEKQGFFEIEEFLLKAHKQIAHLCAENILLWHRFLDLIVGKDQVRVYLANLHHQLRVKRWGEGFYITSNPLRSAYTSKDYTPIVELLKKSINYTPLPIECTEIDGDSNTIPIIFEDQFVKNNNGDEGGGAVTDVNTKDVVVECSCGVVDKKKKKKNVKKQQQRGGAVVGKSFEDPGPSTATTKINNPSPSNGESTLTTELTAKLTLLLEPNNKQRGRRRRTLPRRHSSHHHTPHRMKKKSCKTLSRKFKSTPGLLNNEQMVMSSGGSEGEGEEEEESGESGWVGSTDSGSGSGSGGEGEELIKEAYLLPPPQQFQDDDNKKINPPESFRDTSSSSSSSSSVSIATTPTVTPHIKLTPVVKNNIAGKKPAGNPPPIPYFLIPDELRIFHPKGLHLIVAVHGLDGSCHDLRLFKIYLEVSLPGHNLSFLMSQENQDQNTFTDFDNMTEKLVSEILNHLEVNKLNPTRISFVGHSLGNIIIRSALTKARLAHLLPKLHTFLSLSGPHLGTLYNAGIVNVGMWLMQKWKKSSSLLQLQLKDAGNIRQTFMYKLSEKSNLDKFKYVLLCGSSQDRYVPVHSAHVINCKASLRDQGGVGEAYREMVMNILNPILSNNNTTLIRYDVHHAINPHTANSLIGRAAHIAVLDSEIFIEKFLSGSGGRFFQ